MSIAVRYATPDDAEDVYPFICDLEGIIFDPIAFSNYFRQNLADNRNIYLVAVEGEDVIGFLSCHGQLLLHHMNVVYEIQEMFVNKHYRSKGVGKLLMAALEQVLGKEEYDVLEVASGNERKDTHRFYLNNNFLQTHSKFTRKKQ